MRSAVAWALALGVVSGVPSTARAELVYFAGGRTLSVREFP